MATQPFAYSWFDVCNIDCTDTEELELDVDLGHRSNVLSGFADRNGYRFGDALYATRRQCVRFC